MSTAATMKKFVPYIQMRTCEAYSCHFPAHGAFCRDCPVRHTVTTDEEAKVVLMHPAPAKNACISRSYCRMLPEVMMGCALTFAIIVCL